MAEILVVDDEPKMTSLICGELEDAGHRVVTCVRAAEALSLLDKRTFDIVITDLSMPEHTGMEVLQKALQKDAAIDVIMMTAYGSVETAVKAMKQGAADYLLKPFSLEELRLLVGRLADQQKVKQLKDHYEEVARNKTGVEFIGNSPASQRVKQMIVQVAARETTVLLTGKSGTGKELAARMIHESSPRRTFPFIAINCAALPETLLESELFGHEKGAFTGAVGRKRGRFELAEKGTIFLDEIGEMPLAMQAKLLRVLEEHTIMRLGGTEPVPINVRLVAATNRNLKELIKSGQFREDLYFRLNVFPIEIPTLSQRRDDILPLAEFFLRRLGYSGKLQAEVAQTLRQYDWPGNVRELRNALERALILSDGEELAAKDFSMDTYTGANEDDESLVSAPSEGGLEASERELIIQTLAKVDGNKTEAAKLLKITRRRLYSRMKVHGLET